MSNLLLKSSENLSAGKLLLKEQKYASSIHCFYYSCLQKIIQIASKITNNSPEVLTNLGKQEKKGSHEYVIKIVYDNLRSIEREKKDLNLGRNFNNKINQLKVQRVNSDYLDMEMKKRDSDNAKEYAFKIHELLYQIYEI